MANSDTRSRSYCVILYPEDETHMNALEYVKLNYDSYAYILHNKDIDDETGEIKKSHIHLVIQFKNARYISSLSNEIGLDVNYIQKCRNVENALEYLLHLNHDDKYSYKLEEVKATTDLLNRLKRCLFNIGKDENEKCMNLMEYIINYPIFLEYGVFIKYASSQGQWDVVRRSYSMFKDIIYEHNIKFCTKSDVEKE